MKVSQSLMKGLLEYQNSLECGIVFKAKYLDGKYDLFKPSDAMNAGSWFEYMATGSVPKGGITPKPQYMKKGKDEKGNPRLTAPYQIAQKQVDNFKRMMAHYGLEIIRVGEDVKSPYPNSMERFGVDVTLTGTLDIRVRATKDIWTTYGNRKTGLTKVLVAQAGQICILDLKFSGLIYDRWNDFGWSMDAIDNLKYKVKLTTQPVHYKFIEMINTGEEPPFIFMLFSASNADDAVILDFKVDESAFKEHINFIDNTIINLIETKKKGFQPLPSLKRCSTCPLKDACPYKAVAPPITVFYFGSEA